MKNKRFQLFLNVSILQASLGSTGREFQIEEAASTRALESNFVLNHDILEQLTYSMILVLDDLRNLEFCFGRPTNKSNKYQNMLIDELSKQTDHADGARLETYAICYR